MNNLLNSSAAGQVGHGPSGLLLGLEVSLDEDVNQRLEAASINHQLDLIVVTSCDVRNGPGTLLVTCGNLNIFHSESKIAHIHIDKF